MHNLDYVLFMHALPLLIYPLCTLPLFVFALLGLPLCACSLPPLPLRALPSRALPPYAFHCAQLCWHYPLYPVLTVYHLEYYSSEVGHMGYHSPAVGNMGSGIVVPQSLSQRHCRPLSSR